MRIPMTSFDAVLALEENKNPKKKPPLMEHQKKTEIAGARHTMILAQFFTTG